MSAYMGVNGIPVSANRWLLKDVLRDQLGFDGWVVSDNEAVNSLTTHGLATNTQEAAAKAINAGLDMEMALYAPGFAQLPQAMSAGQVSKSTIGDAVRRVLEAKIRLGLFEHPYVDEARAAKVLRSPEHLELARIAAERAAVLLRNEGSVLPLDRTRVRSVAVIGPLADAARDSVGPWVFDQNQPPLQSVLSGIRAKLGQRTKVTFAPGVKLPPRITPSPFAMIVGDPKRAEPADDTSGIRAAVAATQSSDVAIVVLGEGQDMIGESASRSTLDLPGRQQELLDAIVATGKPVVVVLVNGQPLDLKETKAAAILDVWYPGSRGGEATANLLFGNAVPGGKLPFTWPRNVGQIPLIYSHLTSHDPKGADKRYWNEVNTPAYPFGFGLSYSTFSYGNIRVGKPNATGGDFVVTVDLKNTGARTADEVAQLYIRQRAGTAARPVRELKGFQRVTLKPGELRTLRFSLGEKELRYWNSQKHDWVVDPGTFDLWVGGSSQAILTTTLDVTAR